MATEVLAFPSLYLPNLGAAASCGLDGRNVVWASMSCIVPEQAPCRCMTTREPFPSPLGSTASPHMWVACTCNPALATPIGTSIWPTLSETRKMPNARDFTLARPDGAVPAEFAQDDTSTICECDGRIWDRSCPGEQPTAFSSGTSLILQWLCRRR